MTAEPNADKPMTPTAAIKVLHQTTATVRALAREIRSPTAFASEAAIAGALQLVVAHTPGIEAAESIAHSLLESLERPAERVQELKAKIERLRRLSDDVSATPAEAGTAHRTANKLQTEHDTLTEAMNAADVAVLAFVDARDELWAAYAVFSAQQQRAVAATRSRATSSPPCNQQSEPPRPSTAPSPPGALTVPGLASRQSSAREYRRAACLLLVSVPCLAGGLYLRDQHRQELAQQRARESTEHQAARHRKERAARAAAVFESEQRSQRDALLLRAKLDPSLAGYLLDMSRIREEYDLLQSSDQLEADRLLMKKWGIDQATVNAAKSLALPDRRR